MSDLNAAHAKLRQTDDPIEAFNLFVEMFLPEMYAHFIDSDDNAAEFVRRTIERYVLARQIKHREALGALADMYGQYCGHPYGHDFMSAGERAIDILEDHGLAVEDKEFDWDKVEKFDEETDSQRARLEDSKDA